MFGCCFVDTVAKRDESKQALGQIDNQTEDNLLGFHLTCKRVK